MTPYEHALQVIEFTPDSHRLEAEAHAHALEADAELLGVPAVEHGAHVLRWVESIFEANEDEDAESEFLLRLQEGAALVLVGF
jgi:hypothetical protein